ncbi:serine hydrolase [Actinomycetospora sp. TBRC 11914]|uniref:serine hydrolase n=1 Tax=Actinomycetospora sp. TBRC 11914 TaxID=2729387 RepID=UPI00145F53BC|nr:serine hydrolase [Actinomycetospora sp. TBRC 11914]NMO91058.1 serine hydrolase [Actinomycetospora sp. TBRC 11914]
MTSTVPRQRPAFAGAWGGPGAVTLVPLTVRPTVPTTRRVVAPPSADEHAPHREPPAPRRARRDRRVVPLLRLGLLLVVVAACTSGPLAQTLPGRASRPPSAETDRAETPDPSAVVASLLGPDSRGHVSVAAVDLVTGRSFGAAPQTPVHTASVVKLDVLEALLLQAQDDGRRLGPSVDGLATAMIEDSDNDAATRLWDLAGGAAGLARANTRLGLHGTRLDDVHWGMSTTCAADQVALLGDLVRPGPLAPAARSYATGLLTHVEADQRWGISAAADPGAVTGLKNGWLPLDDDQGRWVVGSVGVTTVAGDPVALAVLSEHQPTEESGIALVEALARTAARAVAVDAR